MYPSIHALTRDLRSHSELRAVIGTKENVDKVRHVSPRLFFGELYYFSLEMWLQMFWSRKAFKAVKSFLSGS